MTIGEAWVNIFVASLRIIGSSEKYKDKTFDETISATYKLAKAAMRKCHAEMVVLDAYDVYTATAATAGQETQIAADNPGSSEFIQPSTAITVPSRTRKGIPAETSAMPPTGE